MPPAKCSLRLGRQVEGRNNKRPVANNVRHVNNLQVPSRLRLTETYPRAISTRKIFCSPTQDLPHFVLSDAMIENVRQTRFRIDPVAQIHSAFLFAGRPLSLLRVEPCDKQASADPNASVRQSTRGEITSLLATAGIYELDTSMLVA